MDDRGKPLNGRRYQWPPASSKCPQTDIAVGTCEARQRGFVLNGAALGKHAVVDADDVGGHPCCRPASAQGGREFIGPSP